jgi:hypothetical protein
MRQLTAIIGGILAGLGLGGGVAAVIESLAANQGASTVPVVIAGTALGMGVGLMVAALVRNVAR